jgi:hypothetical protein
MSDRLWALGIAIAVVWIAALLVTANPVFVFGLAGSAGFLILTLLWAAAVCSTLLAAGAALITHQRAVVWAAIVLMAWLSLLTVNLLRLPIAGTIWIFYLGVLGVAWIVPFVVSLLAFRAAFVLPSAKLAVAIVAIGLAGFVLATQVAWNDVYAVGFYRLNEGGFAQLASASREPTVVSDLADWQAELPASLAPLSASGDLLVAGRCGNELVVFVPVYFGIPDGAIGYINSPCSKEELNAASLDGEGDDLRARIYLGGGWWWAD